MIADGYIGINFTESAASGTVNTGNARLMSLIKIVYEIVCGYISTFLQ